MAAGMSNKMLKNATFKFMVIELLYVLLIGCDIYDLDGTWESSSGINKSNYLSIKCIHIKKAFVATEGVMFVLCLFHYAQILWEQHHG